MSADSTWAKQIGLPAVSGAMAVCFSHPLELTKIRLQLDNELAQVILEVIQKLCDSELELGHVFVCCSVGPPESTQGGWTVCQETGTLTECAGFRAVLLLA
jgi:peptide methionine sulfoxide reductase MsrB